MDIKEVRENAREKMKGFCNVCKICDGVFCSGKSMELRNRRIKNIIFKIKKY